MQINQLIVIQLAKWWGKRLQSTIVMEVSKAIGKIDSLFTITAPHLLKPYTISTFIIALSMCHAFLFACDSIPFVIFSSVLPGKHSVQHIE